MHTGAQYGYQGGFPAIGKIAGNIGVLLLFSNQIVFGSNQFLSSKRFLDILPVLGHGVSSLGGADDALLLGFGGASSKGGCIAVIFGVAGLNFFLGVALFLFFAMSFFLTLGLVSGSEGLNWLAGAGIICPILFSSSKKVLIFLIIVGCRQSLILQGVHLINWVVLSLLKMCIPCIEVIFTSMSTTSTGSLHLKNPCRKLHSA